MNAIRGCRIRHCSDRESGCGVSDDLWISLRGPLLYVSRRSSYIPPPSTLWTPHRAGRAASLPEHGLGDGASISPRLSVRAKRRAPGGYSDHSCSQNVHSGEFGQCERVSDSLVNPFCRHMRSFHAAWVVISQEVAIDWVGPRMSKTQKFNMYDGIGQAPRYAILAHRSRHSSLTDTFHRLTLGVLVFHYASSLAPPE